MTKTVLHVDDDPLQRKMVRLVLQKSGYQVLSFAGGAEALDVLAVTHPGLILLDVNIGEEDGYVSLSN